MLPYTASFVGKLLLKIRYVTVIISHKNKLLTFHESAPKIRTLFNVICNFVGDIFSQVTFSCNVDGFYDWCDA